MPVVLTVCPENTLVIAADAVAGKPSMAASSATRILPRFMPGER
jgi:hypothetical protein